MFEGFNSLSPLEKGVKEHFWRMWPMYQIRGLVGILKEAIREYIKWTIPNYSPSKVKLPDTSPSSSSLRMVM